VDGALGLYPNRGRIVHALSMDRSDRALPQRSSFLVRLCENARGLAPLRQSSRVRIRDGLGVLELGFELYHHTMFVRLNMIASGEILDASHVKSYKQIVSLPDLLQLKLPGRLLCKFPQYEQAQAFTQPSIESH
jgi:hypothetical protein